MIVTKTNLKRSLIERYLNIWIMQSNPSWSFWKAQVRLASLLDFLLDPGGTVSLLVLGLISSFLSLLTGLISWLVSPFTVIVSEVLGGGGIFP